MTDQITRRVFLRRAAARLGAQAYLGAVADPEVAGRHDPDALANGMREALGLGGERGGGAEGLEGQ